MVPYKYALEFKNIYQINLESTRQIKDIELDKENKTIRNHCF
ncbi:hypothetical protein KU06062659_1510002 [Flavobacterium psychrophilum]|nr:hypothetical protein KU06062659_1510002 [Flavobacterium psychrophilum]SNB21285.1 hypothetical protein JIP1600_370006 [Flavobacterium psychrophilum]SNB34970.1 hypothetical protein NO042_480006 [Flavobacterium psychrophilum]